MNPPIPIPDVTPLTKTYWSGLEAGELRFQRCDNCGNVWLPARAECPRCLQDSWTWQASSGRGRLISWVVYHRAFHDAFTDRVPYNVALVELDEGPRLLSNLIDGPPHAEPRIDQPVSLVIQRDGPLALTGFELQQDS